MLILFGELTAHIPVLTVVPSGALLGAETNAMPALVADV